MHARNTLIYSAGKHKSFEKDNINKCSLKLMPYSVNVYSGASIVFCITFLEKKHGHEYVKESLMPSREKEIYIKRVYRSRFFCNPDKKRGKRCSTSTRGE